MNIAIIGGGFSGLTAAYYLSKSGFRVTLFEKERELGGLAVGLKRPNWEWSLELGYHHLFTNDKAILGLLVDLGLGDSIIVRRPVTANYTPQGQMVQFDRPGDLFHYPDFSLADKLRTGGLLAFLKLNPFWQPLEGLTAKQLMKLIGGDHAWKQLWEPLMVGKFSNLAETVAASWMWARINKRTPQLAYIRGGFRTLVTALEKGIIDNKGIIRKGVIIDRIKSTDGGRIAIGKEIFKKLLITVPVPVIIKLMPQLAGTLSVARSIPHLSAQVMILETREPILDEIYWLSVLDRSFPFLAVVAHTNFMSPQYYGGHHLTYFGNYLPNDHKYLTLPGELILRDYMPYINRLTCKRSLKIYNSYHFIGPNAQPVHQLHYSRIAPRLETGIPGVFIANLDSVYPWDRGTNYAVFMGKQAASAIAADSDRY